LPAVQELQQQQGPRSSPSSPRSLIWIWGEGWERNRGREQGRRGREGIRGGGGVWARGWERCGSGAIGSRTAAEGRREEPAWGCAEGGRLGFICSADHLNRLYVKWTVRNDWTMWLCKMSPKTTQK
jgi:hypothetical protein